MPFNSIRWRLQIWYGVILAVLLAGFGFTAFQLDRGRRLRNIDDELFTRVNALQRALRPPPPVRGPDGGIPFGGPPRESPRPERDVVPAPFDRDERDESRPLVREFRLPPLVANLFSNEGTNGFYYLIADPSGRELARSANAPAQVSLPPRPSRTLNQRPPAADSEAEPQADDSREPPPPMRGTGFRMQRQPPRMRGEFREAVAFTPPGETILVGRSIATELSELRQDTLILTGVGASILLLGLAGGWWLAGRAIRPIEAISATAARISAGDLARRIDVADTESELGQLARVLNSTFSRLDTAFAQQQQFTSDAAHELRTPVSVMLTQTQSALTRERSAAEYRETVEACQRSAQRMRRLIESLLELARFDAGQEAIRRVPFDLARTAAECSEQVRPLAAARGISIRGEFSGAECCGDSDRIAQVIINLLTNAIQYSSDKSEIRIATRVENGFAVLEVADRGPGIAPEHLPHVFERFYRADPARTVSQGRAGLGLAISKAIVDAHGGSIEVSSEPGRGSTFTLRLLV
jgi:heavy metal sensor kinase